MIDDDKLLSALRAAADKAGTMGASARMVSDETGEPHTEIVAALDRLEHAGVLGGDTPPCAPRWYSEIEVETAEDREARERAEHLI